MRATLAMLALLALAGCASSGGILRGSGEEAAPPGGYSAFCRQTPRPASCP